MLLSQVIPLTHLLRETSVSSKNGENTKIQRKRDRKIYIKQYLTFVFYIVTQTM